jgi:hypothetical protein
MDLPDYQTPFGNKWQWLHVALVVDNARDAPGIELTEREARAGKPAGLFLCAE